jgi:hypothetical protein
MKGAQVILLVTSTRRQKANNENKKAERNKGTKPRGLPSSLLNAVRAKQQKYKAPPTLSREPTPADRSVLNIM